MSPGREGRRYLLGRDRARGEARPSGVRRAARLVLAGGVALASCVVSLTASSFSARAQEAPEARPTVHLLTTGGTIASRPGENLGGRALLEGVPGLGDAARITVEEFSDIGSSKMTTAHWLRLGRRVRALFRQRPDLAGIVVTHGTDTMEETAFFLHLAVSDPRPVVVTGAMRPPGTAGGDGPANLLDAVRAAASTESRGRGTLVVMNDEIHRAPAVQKAHTSRPDAFVSPGEGPVGSVALETVEYRLPARSGPLHGRYDEALAWDRLPRVRVAYSYAGADAWSLRALADEGAVGLVVASMGRGNLSAAQEEALRVVVERGIPVVVSSRTMAGPVPVGDPGDGIVGAGHLNPQKARVLFSMALTETEDPEALAELYRHFR